jgi:hypothetical protein
MRLLYVLYPMRHPTPNGVLRLRHKHYFLCTQLSRKRPGNVENTTLLIPSDIRRQTNRWTKVGEECTRKGCRRRDREGSGVRERQSTGRKSERRRNDIEGLRITYAGRTHTRPTRGDPRTTEGRQLDDVTATTIYDRQMKAKRHKV